MGKRLIISTIFLFIFVIGNRYYLFAQIDNAEHSANELVKIGSQMYSAGNIDKAIEFFKKALPNVTDVSLKLDVLAMLSSCYLDKGKLPFIREKEDSFYTESIRYAEEALKLNPGFWYALANIGTVYMNMDDMNKADFYFLEAEKYADKNDPGYAQLILHHELVKQKIQDIKNR